MKKNTKILLFSVIGIVVLAAVIIVLVLTAPKNSEDEAEATTTTDARLELSAYASTDVETIDIANENDSYTIGKVDVDGTSQWTVVGADIEQKMYDQSKFTTVVGYAAALSASSVVEENATDLAQYGLDKPNTTVTVNYTDGTSKSIIIGNATPLGNTVYIAEKGSSTVLTYHLYKLNSFMLYKRTNYVTTTVMPAYDAETAPTIKKLTIKRSDLELPIVIQALPEIPEDSDSISVYSHTFTSPFNCYLDLTDGPEFLFSMYGLAASEAAYLEVTDETKAATGLDEPQCEVDMLVEDTIYRLYFGDAVYTTTVDETTGAETTTLTGYYGICNQVPDIIYIFSAETAVWVTMKPEDYMSKMFLVPYIYDLTSVSYEDENGSKFDVRIEGNNTDNHFYDNATNEEVDGDAFKELYQYLIAAKGETLYESDEKGALIATITYNYEDASMEPSVVQFYEGVEDREVIIAVNGVNVYKTKPMYTVRLEENAAAFLTGGEIVLTY